MLKIRIIPCLDVDNGRVVKGINFVSLKDAGDPVEQATVYCREGADEITFLDITATHEKREPMIEVIKKILGKNISIDLLKKVVLARIEEIIKLSFKDMNISENIDKKVKSNQKKQI